MKSKNIGILISMLQSEDEIILDMEPDTWAYLEYSALIGISWSFRPRYGVDSRHIPYKALDILHMTHSNKPAVKIIPFFPG